MDPPAISTERANAAHLPASRDDCHRVLVVVHGALGLGPALSTQDPERFTHADAEAYTAFGEHVAEVAEILACSDWTVSQIRAAGRLLASSPDLDDKIRYGRPINAADFERVRRDGKSEGKGQDAHGVERTIVTRSGFAFKVAQAKLYGREEAFGLWEASGGRGRFSDSFQVAYLDSMFAPVRVDDGRTLFRLK